MSLSRPDSKMQLWAEGNEIKVQFERTSDTTGTITWSLPSQMEAYDGAIVLLHTSELTTSNFPKDGQKYAASTNFVAPAGTIDGAVVVHAGYGDKLSNSVNVVGLDPANVYFASVHAVTNTLEYFTQGALSYVSESKTDTFTGDIPQQSSPPTAPTVGQVYYNSTTAKVQMWTGTAWITVSVRDVQTGDEYPTNPVEGDFFYHKPTGQLYGYNGTGWSAANTENAGIPMQDKHNVGTDGSIDEYDMLIRQIKGKLGWPAVCVELTEQHFINAIDNAIQEFRRRADNAYRREYFFVKLKEGQDTYYLNDPETGTNRIVEIIDIHRINSLAMVTFGENGVYAQQFLTQFYSPGMVDLVGIHLIHQLSESINNVFAGDIAHGWNESTRELRLYRKIFVEEKVLIETSTERTKQELINDRYAHPWIEDWATAECMNTLGMIRSKFGSLPGPGGGVTLNGSELLSQAQTQFEELRRQIMDMEVGNGGAEFGQHSFVIG